MAEARRERQSDAGRAVWRRPPPPLFLYVWQGKEFLVERFVCVAAKGVTDGKKWDSGAFLGCVAGNGLSSFWLVFTINGTAESEFNQWLIYSKMGKRMELTRGAARSHR